MTYIPLGLKQTSSIFLLLGMGNAAPPPPASSGLVRLWQAGPRGVRTRIVVTSWNDDGTTT